MIAELKWDTEELSEYKNCLAVLEELCGGKIK